MKDISWLNGLIDLPWWGYILVAIGLSQVTIAAVTLYLHRCQAHRSLELHPIVSHFFRLWLWMGTSMKTKSWVAIHRKHHAKCETENDPHSPRIEGIKKVLFEGAELYREEEKNEETLERYSQGTPDDWLERNLYGRKFNIYGVSSTLIILAILFGPAGISIWAVMMLWIPVHAAGIINGAGHYWGYRNYECADDATNLTPIAFWIGGEELHNNHHAYPTSAKFSLQPWEFDIGWLYITVLKTFGLAKVRKVAPQPEQADKTVVDMETVKSIIHSKMHVMAAFANKVTNPVVQQEIASSESKVATALKAARNALVREKTRFKEKHHIVLDKALESNETVKSIYQYRQGLLDLWEKSYQSHDALLEALSSWCKEAQQSGIESLETFAKNLPSYKLKTV